jgi:hypothetical protein
MKRGEYPDDWEDCPQTVLERDNYKCQHCGTTAGTIQIHHRTPIAEGGSHDLENLETIRRSCHAAEDPTHTPLSSNHIPDAHRDKYRSNTGTRVREVDPYALELHDGIQYFIGHDYYRDELRHFRPTRLTWVEELDETFDPLDRYSG